MNANVLRGQIEAALKAAGEAAESARLARAAAIAEIGEILRRDRAAGDLVGIVAAESLTGLTRPTLTEARRDTAAWQELVDLAAAALTDEVAEEELHQRLPALAAWDRAAAHISGIAQEELFRAHGGPMMSPLADVPEADQLRAVHRTSIERLAAGRPTGFDADRMITGS